MMGNKRDFEVELISFIYLEKEVLLMVYYYNGLGEACENTRTSMKDEKQQTKTKTRAKKIK